MRCGWGRKDMPDILNARCDAFVGSLDALTSLLEGQVPGLSLPSDQLAPLLAVLATEAKALRGASAAAAASSGASCRICHPRRPCNDD